MIKSTSPTFRSRQRSERQLPRQRGFALVELIIAVTVTALLAVYASAEMARKSEESIAEGAGTYIAAVAGAAETHVLLNFLAYENGTPVAGVANLLQPTVAELVALGRLNPGFPSAPGSVPTRQTLALNVTPLNCPGPTCTLTTLACTTTPVNLGGAVTRFDLASTMVSVQGGRGGQSMQGSGAVIRGPLINTPNPIAGNPEGIVCGSSIVDTALFNTFVRINDTRDPNLQGALTVQGTATFAGPTVISGTTTINNSLTVTGTLSAGTTTVGTCAQILAATGRAGFGCANPNDLPAGYTGGVRSPDVVASGRILASDNPSIFTGSNTNYVFAGIESGVAEMRTSGRAAADRLTPLGSYAPGGACLAADAGSIARNSAAAGLVYCQGGTWNELATTAAAGAACSPNGSMANTSTGLRLLCVAGAYVGMDTIIRSGAPGQACTAVGATAIDVANSNEHLICRTNPAGGGARYMRLRDVTSHLTFVSATEVNDMTNVPKPSCTPAATQTSIPVIQLIGKGYASSDGGVDIYALDAGASWSVRLKMGSGAPLLGSPVPTAIAQVFCYFP